jgi:hypothetical protein
MDILERLDTVSPTIKVQKVFGKGQPHRLVSCQSLWDYFSYTLLPGDGIYELIRPQTLGYLSETSSSPHIIFNPASSFGRAICSLSRRNLFYVLTKGVVEESIYLPTVFTPLTFGPFLPKKKKYKKSVLLKVSSFLASCTKTSPTAHNLVVVSNKVYQAKIRSPLIPTLKVTFCLNPIRFLYLLKIRSQQFPRAGVG